MKSFLVIMKKVKLPPMYGRFTRETMPEIAYNLFKRISEIYGIPIKELTPARGENLPFFVPFHAYDPKRYEVRFNVSPLDRAKERSGKRPMKAENVVTEELLHAAQYLLGSSEQLRKERKYGAKKNPFLRNFEIKYGIEPLAKPYIKSSFLRFLDASGYSTFWMALSIINPKLGLPGFFITTVLGFLGREAMYRYYKKHGIDGLLLLYVDPPKHWNALLLNKKESFFVKNGLLRPDGGFTKKGLRYLREKLPRNVLLENLKLLRNEYSKKFERALLAWHSAKKRSSRRSKRIIKKFKLHKRK